MGSVCQPGSKEFAFKEVLSFFRCKSGISGVRQTVITKDRDDIRLQRSVEEVWKHAQEILAKSVSHPTFESWIRPLQLLSLSGDEATIGVCNEFMKGWITNKSLETIADAISQVIKQPVRAKIVVDSSLQQEAYTPSLASIAMEPPRAREKASPATAGTAPPGAPRPHRLRRRSP